MAHRHKLAEWQQEILKEFYPLVPAQLLADKLGVCLEKIYREARALGLRKAETFNQSELAARFDGGAGKDTRFKPGHQTWNKGMKGYRAKGMEKGWFSPGSKPHTWQPIGSERVADGYLQRKVTDTGYPPRDWVSVHKLIWIEHNGPIPEGHVVVFKDHDHRNFDLENLELISRTELMRRNSVHNYPPEIRALIRLKGSLQRQINNKERDRK